MCVNLQDYLACSSDLQEVLQQDPNVQEAERELEEVTVLLRQSLADSSASPAKPRKTVPIKEVGPLWKQGNQTPGTLGSVPPNLSSNVRCLLVQVLVIWQWLRQCLKDGKRRLVRLNCGSLMASTDHRQTAGAKRLFQGSFHFFKRVHLLPKNA